MDRDRNSPATYSEHEAQRILARAAELEGAIGTRFTAEDLRKIAATADIDSHALERAMNETADIASRPDSSDPVPISVKRLALLGCTGAVLGALAIAADSKPFGDLSTIAIFGPSALFTAWWALRHPLRERASGLLRELGVVFGSFTLAIIATEGVGDVSPAIAWSLVCGALGSVILALRGARVIGSVDSDGALTDGR